MGKKTQFYVPGTGAEGIKNIIAISSIATYVCRARAIGHFDYLNPFKVSKAALKDACGSLAACRTQEFKKLSTFESAYPSEGVAPVIVEQMAQMMLDLKQQGVSILLSGQNMHFAELVSDRAYGLEKGQIRYQASMNELAANADVRRACLSVDFPAFFNPLEPLPCPIHTAEPS